jgi:hypothetical protein
MDPEVQSKISYLATRCIHFRMECILRELETVPLPEFQRYKNEAIDQETRSPSSQERFFPGLGVTLGSFSVAWLRQNTQNTKANTMRISRHTVNLPRKRKACETKDSR